MLPVMLPAMLFTILLTIWPMPRVGEAGGRRAPIFREATHRSVFHSFRPRGGSRVGSSLMPLPCPA
jgi:hypothetical protein